MGTFLTAKVNEVFAAIRLLNCIPEDDSNEQGSIAVALSNLVCGPASNFSISYSRLRINEYLLQLLPLILQ